MSDLDLDAIKARCAAATPGPWEWDEYSESDNETVVASGLKTPDVIPDGDWDAGAVLRPTAPHVPSEVVMKRRDAEFIAHARTDVPALVAEVERWKERAEVAKAAFQVQTREVERLLRVKLKEAHLLRIEAQNPGIDMDEVRRHCCE